MQIWLGFITGVLLLWISGMFWLYCQRRIAARYLYPLWLSVPLHQLLSLLIVLALGITPEQGAVPFLLLLACTLAGVALLLLPLMVFIRYTALCRPLQDKI
jgi:hypothetical protein